MSGYKNAGPIEKAIVISSVIINRNGIICHDYHRRAIKNRVNLNYWMIDSTSGVNNLGDYLSYIVVKYLLKKRNLSLDSPIHGTKHLYAIGSILMTGFQDCTVWGSGMLTDQYNGIAGKIACFFTKTVRKLDIRAVRGPKTRAFLLNLGIKCPTIFGDPAVLMPLFYLPENMPKKIQVLFIDHYTGNNRMESNYISMGTDDYKGVINKICSAKKVISSSLHGIILSEAYGVPAVLLNVGKTYRNLYKFHDYYLSTGRNSFPVASTIDEAIALEAPLVPDFSEMQKCLLDSFPYDLWG